jgi:hypothetical protein
MTLTELHELMVECGLIEISHLQWHNGKFVSIDEFIEGDSAGMMQFVGFVQDRQRKKIADLVERMGIEGYGTLAIAAAIRKGEDDEMVRTGHPAL